MPTVKILVTSRETNQPHTSNADHNVTFVIVVVLQCAHQSSVQFENVVN